MKEFNYFIFIFLFKNNLTNNYNQFKFIIQFKFLSNLNNVSEMNISKKRKICFSVFQGFPIKFQGIQAKKEAEQHSTTIA